MKAEGGEEDVHLHLCRGFSFAGCFISAPSAPWAVPSLKGSRERSAGCREGGLHRRQGCTLLQPHSWGNACLHLARGHLLSGPDLCAAHSRRLS